MRVWRRIAAIGLAVVAVLALAAYGVRREIVAHVAKDLLARRGQPDAVLEVVEVTPWRTRLVEVAADGLRAEAVTLHYEPLKLLRGEFSKIEIEAPRLALDLTRPGEAGTFAVPELPPIRIAAGEIEVVLASGRIGLEVEAEFQTAPGGRIEGSASFDGRSELGSLSGTLQLESAGGLAFELAAGLDAMSPLWSELGLPSPQAGGLKGELSLATALSALERTHGSPAEWLGRAAAEGLSGDLRLQLEDLRWPKLDRPLSLQVPLAFRSQTEALEIALPGEVDLAGVPALQTLAGDQAIVADLLRFLEGATKLSLNKQDGSAPVVRMSPQADGGVVLSYEGRADVEAEGRRRLVVSGRGDLALDRALRPGYFRVEDLQAELRDLNLRGRAIESASFTGSVEGDAGSLRAKGDLQAALRDLQIDPFGFGTARFEAPIAIDAGPEGSKAELTGEGELSWKDARSTLAFALPDTHRLLLTGLQASQSGAEVSYGAQVDPGEMTLRIDDPDKPLDLRAAFEPLQITGRWSEAQGLNLEARIPVRRLTVPQLELEARKILAIETLRPAEGIARVSVTVAELHQNGAEPALAPLALRGRLNHAGAPLSFTAAGSTVAGIKLFELQGRHDIGDGGGSAEISLAGGLFGAAPWRLRELAPAAPDLTVTGGRVAAKAKVAWRDGELQGSGRLDLSEVGMKGPALTLEGLTGELTFAQLFPLRSEPGQSLTARRLDLGETLNDLSARFAVSAQGPDQTLVIDIERAEARSILGPLSVASGRAEPQSGRYRMRLQLVDLDLSKLSETAAIEGLAGEGHLSGMIPLEVFGSELRIADASLSNRGQGVLRFRSEAASRALAAGGEPVELMLRALEDFRYEELKLSANTSDGEELELFITMLGQNPAVLEGHPFRFNIRLASNLPQLVEVLQQGSGLTQGVLGKLWKFRQ